MAGVGQHARPGTLVLKCALLAAVTQCLHEQRGVAQAIILPVFLLPLLPNPVLPSYILSPFSEAGSLHLPQAGFAHAIPCLGLCPCISIWLTHTHREGEQGICGGDRKHSTTQALVATQSVRSLTITKPYSSGAASLTVPGMP